MKGISMSNILLMRTSTIQQSLRRQEVLKEKYHIDKVFEEHMSGKSVKDRPAIKEMLDYIRDGDSVYCLSLDRCGRNLKELKEVVETITQKGATIHFEKENLTFGGENDHIQKLMFHLLCSFYEFERENLLDRQRYGIQKAVEAGKYSKERAKKLNPVMRENMINDRKIGMSIADIIKKYHISRKTYYNYLANTSKI